MNIAIPRKLIKTNFNQNLKDLDKDFTYALYNERTVTFDFTNCYYLSPTAIVYISLWRDLFKQKDIKTLAKFRNDGFKRFVKDFGMIDIGLQDEEYTVYKKYMIKLNRCYTAYECLTVQNEIIKLINKKCKLDKGTFAAIDYMLNEIRDNAAAHGYKCYDITTYPKPIYICGFNYKDKIEIAIADCGQGIYNSLRNNNAQFLNSNPFEALEQSINDKVSGHPFGSPGFGLYCSTEFVKQCKGTFSIWSSGVNLFLESNGKKIYKSAFNNGTIICFTINKDAKIPFNSLIKHYTDADDYIDNVIEGSII